MSCCVTQNPYDALKRQASPLVAALWSLREDAMFAHKQALNGEPPNLVTLDQSYQNVIKAVMKLDNEK